MDGWSYAKAEQEIPVGRVRSHYPNRFRNSWDRANDPPSTSFKQPTGKGTEHVLGEWTVV
ncbi:hypothetical protein GCM10028819_48430 [Spirosoma humi]